MYFAQRDDLVKIGISNRPEHRIRNLQVGAGGAVKLLGTILAMPNLEKELHRQFRALRVHGEWFKAAPALLEYVKAHCFDFYEAPDAKG